MKNTFYALITTLKKKRKKERNKFTFNFVMTYVFI